MWIQVRTFDGKQTAQIDELSKLTKIEELRKKLENKFDVLPEQQRLFYRGKQMEDGHTLFDYNVQLNDIVQLMIRSVVPVSTKTEKKISLLNGEQNAVNGLSNGIEQADFDSNNNEKLESEPSPGELPGDQVSEGKGEASSSKDIQGLYKVGDIIDALDPSMGAWFEAEVVDISLADIDDTNSIQYHVRYDGYSDDEIKKLSAAAVRPRARTVLLWDQLSVGQIVMANYNPDEPEERGYWYDVEITEKLEGLTRNSNELYAKLLLKTEENQESVAQKCKITFTDEIYKIEPAPEFGENGESITSSADTATVKRQNIPDCSYCKDDPNKKCKHCNCYKCGGKDDPDKQLLCDECNLAYHIYCLDPPLDSIPDDDEWYCPLCKNDTSEVIHAGEKLRQNKKKSKMASASSSSNRDWGKGMACVGRTKVCTIVPPNHFGSIPGVPVGSLWKFRLQVSEAGIHRPHVSGIHGRDSEGAYSIVLAGGYEDDVDNGEEFIYTGSGGRDLSGNKRTAEQSCDQKLTKMNRALARICAAPLDDKKGGEAKNWKEGKPVRVVRSSKLAKHSKYAPEEGNRYDGLYKVVKYWPEKGISGFIIWRYKLRRDDESPAPWTKEGKKMISELGLKMKYPEGYLEAQAKKQELQKQEKETAKGKGKRKRETSITSPHSTPSKKKAYSLDSAKKMMIAADEENKKVWSEILAEHSDLQSFMHKVEETFQCICCQDVVCNPVTTGCGHNICKACLARSFKAGIYSCPTCRTELGKGYKMTVNSALEKVLHVFFPGYTKGR